MSFEICHATVSLRLDFETVCKVLESIAEDTENIVWQIIAPNSISSQKVLNELQPKILQTDDKDLISLYRRAVQMHDTLHPEEKANPVELYQKHYQPPKFQIPNTEVILDVREEIVFVTTHLSLQRVDEASTLILHGKDHQVVDVTLNSQTLKKGKDYIATPHELIVKSLPNESTFHLCIISKIDPQKNHSFKGLYFSENILTTHCESEGARHIFFTLDRPDVLSEYKVTLIADPKRYPSRLSNGNLISNFETSDGRMSTTWHDPFKKPSYLFAAVLGDFAVLEDTYQKKDGTQVSLRFFVQHDKKEKAHFALHVLKKALQFEEEKFDRPYDLDVLKCVAIPGFNSGAMENKGLIIFNESCVLANHKTAIDSDYLMIADIVSHELCHNWSGNRVTIRDWFELALKEAFTDFRASLFLEDYFGHDFIRLNQVLELQEKQFPLDETSTAHSVQVKSFVDPRSIYDATTYVKGREVFRMLWTLLEGKEQGLFRKAQNLYFQRYDGQAVTFKELLQTMEEVSGINLKQFKRWFRQLGTPVVTIKQSYDPDEKKMTITLEQSCLHPKTKEEQKPLHIPFALEVLSMEGKVICKKHLVSLTEKTTTFVIENIYEKVIPVFLHDYSAPIKCNYVYDDDELKTIMLHASDFYPRFVAGKIFMKKKILEGEVSGETLETIYQILNSENLSLLEKATFLELPSLRSLIINKKEYDFHQVYQKLKAFKTDLASKLHSKFCDFLSKCPSSNRTDPKEEHFSQKIIIRRFRSVCLEYLSLLGERYFDKIWAQYIVENTFTEKFKALELTVHSNSLSKEYVLNRFYSCINGDKALFYSWLRVQATSPFCTFKIIKKLAAHSDFDANHPYHVHVLWFTFINNLIAFHDQEGQGYALVVSEIIRLSKENSELAQSLLSCATVDFSRLSSRQKKKMEVEIRRLTSPELPSSIVSTANKLLES